jgi:hypothetical protein
VLDATRNLERKCLLKANFVNVYLSVVLFIAFKLVLQPQRLTLLCDFSFFYVFKTEIYHLHSRTSSEVSSHFYQTILN